MVQIIDEPIDLINPMPTIMVVGFDKTKRKTFNQVMTKCFNSIKNKAVLNDLYNSMNDKVIEQDSNDGRNESPTKDEMLIQYLDEKIFK